MKEEKTIMT